MIPIDDTVLTGDRNTGRLTINMLKYIAVAAMVIDHAAAAFVPHQSTLYIIMRCIGRITGPVMFFAAAEGYHHTKNINRYMARLAVFALISYLPFLYFLNGGILNIKNWLGLNIIYTIFIGVAAIRVRREIGNPVIKIILLVCLVIVGIPGDWGSTGVLMILTFDYFYGSFRYQAAAFCLIVLFKSGILSLVTQPFIGFLSTYRFNFNISGSTTYIISAGQFIPILLLYFYNNRKGRGGKFSKWFFYIFYPAHLIVLGFIRTVL